MKYNIGDKVRIKSIDWYNENKGNVDKTNSVWCADGRAWFFYHMSQHCGKIMTIKNVWAHSYTFEGSDSRWTDEMIEGLVGETELDSKAFADGYDQGYDDGQHDMNEWNLPDGFIFKDENGNAINATKIVLEKKKFKYPNTPKECCEVLNTEETYIGIGGYKGKLLEKFQRLLICRNAYWKIAGEEMGMGNPWEPNWTSFTGYPAIYMYRYQITLSVAKDVHHCLTFPTEEMRDVFYENFKDLIEQCKELL